MIHELPQFLIDAVRPVKGLRSKVDALTPRMSNCLNLVKVLSNYTHEEILIMLHCELMKDSPRGWVVDKLHARTCKLTRQEQRAELSKIVELK